MLLDTIFIAQIIQDYRHYIYTGIRSTSASYSFSCYIEILGGLSARSESSSFTPVLPHTGYPLYLRFYQSSKHSRLFSHNPVTSISCIKASAYRTGSTIRNKSTLLAASVEK